MAAVDGTGTPHPLARGTYRIALGRIQRTPELEPLAGHTASKPGLRYHHSANTGLRIAKPGDGTIRLQTPGTLQEDIWPLSSIAYHAKLRVGT